MDTMNQVPSNQAPMGTPMKPGHKKSGAGVVMLLLAVAIVIALLVFSQNEKVDESAVEESNGTAEVVNNNSDELDAMEADIDSMNFDDIDAGLQ